MTEVRPFRVRGGQGYKLPAESRRSGRGTGSGLLRLRAPSFRPGIHQPVPGARERLDAGGGVLAPFLGTYTVCTLFVPRGEEPLHFLDGVIYLRYGSSDIKAQPEMVKRLLAAHAF